jgi:predicted fused transcriptional regulator/phosphomethylpyrimidine kinase
VRKYGRDYIDRLKSVGFNVTVIKREELASEEEINRMCLKEDSEIWGFVGTEIFYCRK